MQTFTCKSANYDYLCKTKRIKIMEFENRLRQIRKQKAVTVTGLAAAVGVSEYMIYRSEQGVTIPSVFLALRIAKFLNVKLEEIFKLK